MGEHTYVKPQSVTVRTGGFSLLDLAAVAVPLALLAAVCWFCITYAAELIVIAAVLAASAAALCFVAWKYGPQIAGFRYLRSHPAPAVRARVVRAAVLPRPLPAPAPAAIAPVHILNIYFEGNVQPEAVLRAIAESKQQGEQS
jgi:hypothetical protein